jgi:RNA polymerase sigma-70 factor, ECF subfamily
MSTAAVHTEDFAMVAREFASTFETGDRGDWSGCTRVTSDEELMARVAHADHAACQQLVERHFRRIRAFAVRTLRDRTAAEDVAQEVLTRLWIHAKRWQPGAACLTTWLHRIAMNLCLDHLTRKREEALDDIPEPPDPSKDAAARLQERDLCAHVTAALLTLSNSQRAAVTLCHYQGLRNAEAAAELGVSVEALESLLARARRTLRERLRPVAPELLGDS